MSPYAEIDPERRVRPGMVERGAHTVRRNAYESGYRAARYGEGDTALEVPAHFREAWLDGWRAGVDARRIGGPYGPSPG